MSLNRFLDVTVASAVLALFSPVILLFALLIFLGDLKNPIYSAKRVGLDNVDFTMFKLRSMRIDADKTGVSSTGLHDARITRVGHVIRKLKIDELSQFLNVLLGDMSIVGPRPNTRKHGVDLYTETEMELLTVKPGITDFSSIVFSNEGEILNGSTDPDEAYNRLIRPGKSELGLLYIKHKGVWLDLQLIFLTALTVISKKTGKSLVAGLVYRYSGRIDLKELCEGTNYLTSSYE